LTAKTNWFFAEREKYARWQGKKFLQEKKVREKANTTKNKCPKTAEKSNPGH